MNFISYISTRGKNSCKHFGFVHRLWLGGACVYARAMVWHQPSKATRKLWCILQGLDVGVIWGSPKQTTNPCCFSLIIPAGKTGQGSRVGINIHLLFGETHKCLKNASEIPRLRELWLPHRRTRAGSTIWGAGAFLSATVNVSREWQLSSSH